MVKVNEYCEFCRMFDSPEAIEKLEIIRLDNWVLALARMSWTVPYFTRVVMSVAKDKVKFWGFE